MKRSSKLTQEAVEAASPRSREYIIMDAGCDGLALRVRPNGSKSWQFRWREGGRLRRVSLGPVAEVTLALARERATDGAWMRDDPGGANGDRGVRFGDLAAAFVKMKEESGIRSHAPRAYIRSQLIPTFGHVPAAELSTPRIAAWFHAYSSDRPGGANEALVLLAAVLAYGRAEGRIPADTPDPCAPIRKNPRRNAGRILSADGLAALGRVLRRPYVLDPEALDVISLILFTGCRSGEILRLRWDEVSHDRLSLKQAKTGARDVLLSEPAKRILRRLKPDRMGVYVFPSKETISEPRRNIDAAWRRIKDAAGLDPAFRLHDLRHSYASHAVMGGETLYMTGRLLGHRNPASTERYAHYDGAFLSAAAERVCARVAKMIG